MSSIPSGCRVVTRRVTARGPRGWTRRSHSARMTHRFRPPRHRRRRRRVLVLRSRAGRGARRRGARRGRRRSRASARVAFLVPPSFAYVVDRARDLARGRRRRAARRLASAGGARARHPRLGRIDRRRQRPAGRGARGDRGRRRRALLRTPDCSPDRAEAAVARRAGTSGSRRGAAMILYTSGTTGTAERRRDHAREHRGADRVADRRVGMDAATIARCWCCRSITSTASSTSLGCAARGGRELRDPAAVRRRAGAGTGWPPARSRCSRPCRRSTTG